MRRSWGIEPEDRSPRATTMVGSLEGGGSDERLGSPRPRPRPREAQGRLPADPWVVILAGGEGHRIRSYTTRDNGVPVPKQFCRFRDDRTLLGMTIDRALRLTPPERVIVVLLEAHRAWWGPDLVRLPPENALAQPLNRGTGIAILHALVEIHLRDRHPRLIVMPSDHDVENEPVLLRTARVAYRTAGMFPEELVLLGIPPSHLDCEYGLVVPAHGRPGASQVVRAFVEKPSLTLAARLGREGALWNSFIFACDGGALYDRFEDTMPSVARAYLTGLALTRGEPESLASLFEHLPERDFGRDVLQHSASSLRMLAVPPCGWTDLGTPARLAAWLDAHRDAAFWREHPPVRPPEGGDWGGMTHVA